MATNIDLIIDRIDDLREDVRNGFDKVSDRLKTSEDAISELKSKQDETKGERRVSARMYNALSTVFGGAIVAGIDAVSNWYSNGGHH